MRPPAFWADPAAALHDARETSAVGVSPGGQKLVLRHAEADAVLRDSRMRTLGTALLENVGVHDGPLHEWWRLVMFNTNPPEHTRLRSLVSRAFTPRAVAKLRPRIAARIEELLAEARPRGEIDLVDGFAHRLPIRVTCDLLGVPESLHEVFADKTTDLGLVFSATLPEEQRARCEDAVSTLREASAELVAERRAKPQDDLLSALVAAEEAGDRLEADELVAMVLNLLFAGSDTTRGMLSLGLWLLLRHPEEAEALRADPGLAANATDEILRFEPPVFGSLRAPAEPLEIGGVPCEVGEPVNVIFAAASRDPRAYASPDRFDIRRAEPRPLGFGAGAHYCLGAALARTEGELAFPAVLAALPELEPIEEVSPVPYAAIRRLPSLRARFRA